MKPIVAIIGRPNVGKSTLFNRMTRSRKAIVDNFPGVTRDRMYADAQWDDSLFTVVDTGGFSSFESEDYVRLIRYQVDQAMEEADALILLFDGREGITPVDLDLVEKVRRSNKPAFYGINKIDTPQHESLMADFASLGIDPLFPVSAEHRYGMNDFMDAVCRVLPRTEPEPEPDSKRIRLAVIGRPNVGKSSLINRLLGDERLVVSPIPGTTRDAVDTLCKVGQKEYVLVDTAGIRKKKQVHEKIEKFSIIKALRALGRCDIALVILDASTGLSDQDAHIAGYVAERDKACILLLNKWDLVEPNDNAATERYVAAVKERFKFLSYAPTLTISALTGKRAFKIFDWITPLYEQYTTRVTTGELNRILKDIIAQNGPPMHRGRRIKIFYGTETSTAPPTFVFFANYPEGIPVSYERYMTNRLREALHLDLSPLRVVFRKREKGK